MWSLVFFAYICISCVNSQNGNGPQLQHDHNGHGWDIRLAVPGEPGDDYPTLNAIPRTSFSCAGREPGYYTDIETDCQVFRVCTVGATYGFQSFLCPNGTLFNQAVFVCDWWMHVNCGKSQELFTNNNEKFGDLKLGPQLMKDIKKMLTHPMRNPYDKNEMKSNLVVMQNYKPPSGQLFPNGALLAGPERTPNNIYVPAKQVQHLTQSVYSSRDNTFSASTPNPQYIPSTFNNIQSTTQKNSEFFQSQKQNSQYVQINRVQNTQNSQNENIISNGLNRQITQARNATYLSNNDHAESPRSFQNAQYTQKQTSNVGTTLFPNNQNIRERGQYKYQNNQYTNNRSLSQYNSGKATEFGISLEKQQIRQEKQPYTYQSPLPLSANHIPGQIGNEAKQNLVSNDVVPPTLITKMLAFKRIVQDSKPGQPKSRITFKTWVVKPSRFARLSTEPTPYTYSTPIESFTEKLTDETVPYVYNKPTTLSQNDIITPELDSDEPYFYNTPTVAAKQISTTVVEPLRSYLTPTTPRPTPLARLYLAPTSTPPTKSSPLYLPPTTFKPDSRYYLPPSQDPATLSRQYLVPNTLQQQNYQSARLRIAPTPTTTEILIKNTNKLPFSTSRSHDNANNNNLTFTDILTKEKLDIKVHEIVKDTSKILKTATPRQFSLLQEIPFISFAENTYLPPEPTMQTYEKQTALFPAINSKSARIITNLSRDLQPPFESYNIKNANQLSNLAYFKKQSLPTNTIERTVTLKLTIPEKVAAYLFKAQNESNYDRLEILNTGSSNYLVLANKPNNNIEPSFIPIGKLIINKKSNFSNSQVLVFSLLADSVNLAKEYSNIAQQQVTSSTPAQSQYPNMNSEQLAHITDKISQLTSSQYSGNNYNRNINNANIPPTVQTTTIAPNQFTGPTSYTNNFAQNQAPRIQSENYNSALSQQNTQGQFYSSQIQDSNNLNTNLQINKNQKFSKQLYQLPVPDVNQIYNEQKSVKLVQSNDIRQQNSDVIGLQHNFNGNSYTTSNNILNNNNSVKQPSADVEIIQSQSLPYLQSNKLQIVTSNEPTVLNNQQNSEQAQINDLLSGNGISAQLQDNIIGTTQHPSEDNKIVTYKKDNTYYIYTKLDNNALEQNIQGNVAPTYSNNIAGHQSARLTESSNADNLETFQVIPSVSYQLEDEKEQQNILNTFQINNFGNPLRNENNNGGYLIQNPNQKQDILSTNVGYSVDHSSLTQQNQEQNNNINTLYAGPSSYLTPQRSVGSLKTGQEITNNNYNSRLEKFNENNGNGYPKVQSPSQFL